MNQTQLKSPESESVFSRLNIPAMPDIWRKVISESLFGSGKELICSLKENQYLANLFEADARVMENYSIEEHSEMVINQFDRYLSQNVLPANISLSEFRLFLALHDIGKSIPENKHDQHASTIEVIKTYLPVLPISESNWGIFRILIENDLVGKLIISNVSQFSSIENRKTIAKEAESRELTFEDLKAFSSLVTVNQIERSSAESERLIYEQVQKCADEITRLSTDLNLNPKDLWKLMLTFFQSDTSAYTYDAQTAAGRRASPGLEYLYLLRENFKAEYAPLFYNDSGLIKFSKSVQPIIDAVSQILA